MSRFYPRNAHLGFFSCCLALALWTPVSQGQIEIRFALVAEELWNDGAPDNSHFLPSGRVFLYRAGSYIPELVAKVDEPQVVTPGNWLWISEAEDDSGGLYVSVVSGKILYPEGAERFDRGLLGPVVPACRVDLGPARLWQGVTRLDAVSLERHAVYPVVVKDRQQFHVPAGRFLVYTVDEEGVTAISRVVRCDPHQTVEISRPEPPSASSQDLMVSVQMPEGQLDKDLQISAVLAPRNASRPLPPQPPTAALRTNYRTTFFFLDVDARDQLELNVRHPEALPQRQEISPLQGGVRELPDIVLEAQ